MNMNEHEILDINLMEEVRIVRNMYIDLMKKLFNEIAQIDII